MARLPEPPDDLRLFRTYPNRPNRGKVTFEELPDGSVHFVTRLPRRFGAVGATRKGLFANGAWYPQAEGLPTVSWEVTVTLPRGATAALGDQVGQGTVRWTGTADRAPLAVVRRGRVADIHGGVLLSRGPAARLARELDRDLSRWPHTIDGVAVRAPLRRRLVRPGPGLAYVSDRAFRLTPGLEFAHRRAVARGVATAWTPEPDPLLRSLRAAGGLPALDAQLAIDTERFVRRWSWIPQIHSLLASQRMAFFADVLDLPFSGDAVQDDLAEIYAPTWTGAAVALQLDDRFGPGTAQRLGEALAELPLPDALATVQLPPDVLDAYRAPTPVQDYRLHVTDAAVRVERVPDGPDEVVVVRIDGEDHPLVVHDPVEIPLSAPARRVELDPAQHVAQTERARDHHPLRITPSFAAAIDTVNFGRGQVFGLLYAGLRRQGDTRHFWAGTLSNSRSDLVKAGVTKFWKVGPLLDGYRRQHVLRTGVSTSILDTRFADTDGLRVATDLSAGWAWDTRVSDEFPLRGQRVAVSVSGGGVPSADPETWAGGDLALVGLLPLHPRLVVAGRTTAALARSNVPHRLLALGGLGAMRSVPVLPACVPGGEQPCAELATERWFAAAELRAAVIRNASVPMVLLWGSELQLTGGLEGVVADVSGAPVRAWGATAGVLGVGDVLGAEAMSAGLIAGWTLGDVGLDLQPSPWPELYLRWEQAF